MSVDGQDGWPVVHNKRQSPVIEFNRTNVDRFHTTNLATGQFGRIYWAKHNRQKKFCRVMTTRERAIAVYEAGEHREAFDTFQRFAEGGDAVAMRYLGRLFAKGEGCPEDVSESAQWYLRAWKAKEEPAAHELAGILPRLERKAEDGEPLAQFAVGMVYMHLKEDTETGLGWLTRSADQDHPEALQLLGELLPTPGNRRRLGIQVQSGLRSFEDGTNLLGEPR